MGGIFGVARFFVLFGSLVAFRCFGVVPYAPVQYTVWRTHAMCPNKSFFVSTIHLDFWPINHVRRDKGLLETRLDTA